MHGMRRLLPLPLGAILVAGIASTVMATDQPEDVIIYVSSSSSGVVDSIEFKDEDILAYSSDTDIWAMHFDGSDVGLIGADIDAVHVLTDNNDLTLDPILFSLQNGRSLGDFFANDSDIVRFTPTSLGVDTAGTFTMEFDGSDFGLTTPGEAVDAIGFTPGGRLVVSTGGNYKVPADIGGNLSGKDEDLIVQETSGDWGLYFDGSDVDLTASTENVWGVWIDDSGGGDIFLTTKDEFSIPGDPVNPLVGDQEDVFVFSGSVGSTTLGTFSAFWDGDTHGLPGERLDGISIEFLNVPPDAVDDGPDVPSYVTDEDTVLSIADGPDDILANDSDPDGDPFAVTELNGSPVAFGSPTAIVSGALVTLFADGSFDYDPNSKFEALGALDSDTDSFDYTIADIPVGATDSATVTITITGVNDAPVVTTSGGSTAFTEGAGAVTVDGTVTVTDVDDTDLASATVTITNLLDGASEVLGCAACGAITPVYVAGTLTLTGPATVADFQTALQSVTYDNANLSPDTTTRIIRFVANDGTDPSADADKTVTVAATNDAPVVTTSGGSTPFTEGAGAVTVDGAVTVTDTDDTLLDFATVTITNQLDGTDETLAATASGGILGGDIAYVPATGILTIDPGTDQSLADFEAVLQSVTYDNANLSPDTTTRIIRFVANDGTDPSANADKTVTIGATDDPPDLNLDFDNSNGSRPNMTATYIEGVSPVTIVDSDVTITDVDDTNMESATATITNAQDAGVEELDATAGSCVGIALGGTGTATLTLVGSATIAAYETCLATVTYEHISTAPTDLPDRIVNFTVNDGTSPSTVRTSTIDVVPGNSAPTANPDSYDTVGNTELQVAATKTITTGVFVTGDVLSNDTDDGPGALTVTGTSGVSVGATVNMAADGTFTYAPPPGATTTDSFDYTVSDTLLSSTGTVTITFVGEVWYVDNTAAGTGTSTSPFSTLAAAETASGVGDTIYIFEGDATTIGQDTGITLAATQQLIGAGAALEVPLAVNGGTSPTTLRTVGASTPEMANTAGNGITLAANNTIRGLDVGTSGGSGLFGSAVGSLIVSDVGSISSIGGAAIDLTSGSVTVTVTSVVSTNSTGKGLNLNTISGTFNVNGGSITGSAGTAVDINGGTGNISYAGSVTNSSGRSVEVTNRSGGTVSLSGSITDTGSGIFLTTNTGATISFTGTVDLDTSLVNGTSFAASGGGTINVTGSGNTVDVADGQALDLTSVTIDMDWAQISSTSSGNQGIDLVSVSGILDVSGGTTIVSSSGPGVNISSSPGTFAFGDLDIDNTATDTIGIAVSGSGTVNSTSGTITTENAAGVDIDGTTLGMTLDSASVDGGTVGIDINGGGSSSSFTITGSGILDGTGGTIQNTTQNGILIQGTDNITLNNIDLTNAADEAGGCTSTLFGTCTASLELNTASGVSIDNLDMSGSDEHGLFGQNVTDLDISDSSFTNLGNGTDENAIFLVNLLGTSAASADSVFDNVTITGAGDNGIQINNSTSTNAGNTASPDLLTVQNSTMNSSGVGGIQAITDTGGTGNLRLDVTGSSFSANASVGIATNSNGGDLQTNITGNMILHGAGTQFRGLSGGATSTGDLFFTVTGNTITANNGGAGTGPSGIAYANIGTGNMNGTIGGAGALTNNITNNTPTGVTSVSGVSLINNGGGSSFIVLNNNTITVNDGFGVIANTQGANSGSGDFHILGNFVTVAGADFVNTAISANNSSSGGTQCLNISSNTLSTNPGGNVDILLETGATTTFQVQQATGTTTGPWNFTSNDPGVELDVNNAQVSAPGGTIVNPFTPTAASFTSGTCTNPSSP